MNRGIACNHSPARPVPVGMGGARTQRAAGWAIGMLLAAAVLCAVPARSDSVTGTRLRDRDAAPLGPQLAAEGEAGPEFATPTTLDRSGRIVAPVRINGRGPFRFILDTGANRSAMSAATARAVDLVPSEDATVSVHGITGSAALPVVHVERFEVGELAFKDQRMPVLPSAVFGGVDGILGIDCLQQARVEVDFGEDRVTISRSRKRRASSDYLVVPARLKHGGLLQVNGRVGRVRVNAILDTGAERSLGNPALQEALVLRARSPHETELTTVIGATPQLVQGTSFKVPAIAIGGARLSNLTVTFGDLHVFNIWSLLEQPALLIGMDLLGTLQHFVVDYPRREFHLKTWSSGGPGNSRCLDLDCRVRLTDP